jgi:dolichol-phosphate mannosyltransferase
MDKLYIIIPAYNEQESIGGVIEEWHEVVSRIGQGSKLVILNDGSKDSTLAIASQMSAGLPLLDVIDKPNSGHGPTCLFGYGYAIKQGADYVFQTDSDGQTKVSDFWKFWEKRKDADFIIGFRKVRGDGIKRWFVSRFLRLALLFIFQVFVKDANTPFRLMKTAALQKYLPKIPPDFYLANVLLSVLAVYGRSNILWLEITFAPRLKGESSVPLKKIIHIGWRSILELSKIRKQLPNR